MQLLCMHMLYYIYVADLILHKTIAKAHQKGHACTKHTAVTTKVPYSLIYSILHMTNGIPFGMCQAGGELER